jgi:hypothetical protein
MHTAKGKKAYFTCHRIEIGYVPTQNRRLTQRNTGIYKINKKLKTNVISINRHFRRKIPEKQHIRCKEAL